MSKVRILLAALSALAVLAALMPAAFAQADAPAFRAEGEHVTVAVVSDRGDVVSGGDALVELRFPAGTTPDGVVVDVDGRDVTDAFAVRSHEAYVGRFVGLVEGLALGANIVSATLPDGRGARLTVTNHPVGGPVFSGPQIQPWTCLNEVEGAQCNQDPECQLMYMPSGGGGFQPYDPESPPTDVGETTTDEGMTVPFIIREETGVLDRDTYAIAVLYDPDEAWEPAEPQEQFNQKLVITHGASCDTAYEMGDAPDVLLADALGRGFAVMSHALDNAGHNCNIATEAEALVMTKERVVERYGELRYTIGSGCSGGSLVQQQVANAYPGLYQGITPQCSFTDAWSSSMRYVDYVALRSYFEDPTQWAPGVAWEPASISGVYGHPNAANPVTFTEVIPNSGDPSRACPGVPDADVYDAEANPDGVRCSFQDYMINVFGRDPRTGFARRPVGDTGIQYGYEALLAGLITPAQFVDVNAKVGDFEPVPERVAPDPTAAAITYRTGANNTASNLDQVAIIDLRGPDPGAFHDVYRTYVMRERLIREHGTADNQVLWRVVRRRSSATSATSTSRSSPWTPGSPPSRPTSARCRSRRRCSRTSLRT